MSKAEEKIESLMEEKYYDFFYEPSPHVEQTLKNMFNIYEVNDYPQTWGELRSHLNFSGEPYKSDIPDKEVLEEGNRFEVFTNYFKQMSKRAKNKDHKKLMNMTAREKEELEEVEKWSN